MISGGLSAPCHAAYSPDKNDISGVYVAQTDCIGLCKYEPIVEVHVAGKEKVTYVKVDADKAAQIIEKHLKGGQIVTEYTIGA